MLNLKNISKKFGESLILESIDLNLDKGKVIGLLGPNGAGKTTLMRIITGFYQKTEGEIIWGREKADTRENDFKKNIGYLPENNPLYLSMTVLEYLNFIAEIKGLNGEKLKTEIINKTKDCGLEEVIGKKIETLSKGYKQRVGLAAAMICDPPLLVLDEPTSGLDPNQIIEIRELIKRLAKKRTILLSTHILPEAKSICDRIVIINRGRIVLNEETKKIRNLEKKFIELTV